MEEEEEGGREEGERGGWIPCPRPRLCPLLAQARGGIEKEEEEEEEEGGREGEVADPSTRKIGERSRSRI